MLAQFFNYWAFNSKIKWHFQNCEKLKQTSSDIGLWDRTLKCVYHSSLNYLTINKNFKIVLKNLEKEIGKSLSSTQYFIILSYIKLRQISYFDLVSNLTIYLFMLNAFIISTYTSINLKKSTMYSGSR